MVFNFLFPRKRLPETGARFFPALFFATLLLGLAACSGTPEGPVSALHHFRKGNEAYAIENYERAIKHFERALALDENTAEIYYNLGLAYFHTENHEQAVGAFQGALRVNPAMSDAHYNLALAYDRLYDPEAAHSHFNSYRSMVAGRSESGKYGGQSGAETKRKNGGAFPTGRSLAGGVGAAGIARAGLSKGGKGGKAGAKGGVGRKTAGRPAARRGNRARGPMGRHGPPPQAPGHSNKQAGDSNKWWTQDRFNQKP